MSRPSPLVRIATVLLSLAAARDASAQLAWAQVQLTDAATGASDRRTDSPTNSPIAAASAAVSGVFGDAFSNYLTGQLKVDASTSENRHVSQKLQSAGASAGLSFRMSIVASCPPEGCAPQPLELYFHAVLTGSTPLDRPGFNASAGAGLGATVWKGSIGPGNRFIDRTLSSVVIEAPGGGAVGREDYLSDVILIPLTTGLNTFVIVLTLDATAWNGFAVDASRTGTVYVPTVAGYAYDFANGALSAQARPTWATVTTPEPSTLALSIAGLLALGAAVGRRSARRAR